MTIIHVIGLVDLANTLPRLSVWARHYCPRPVAGLLLVTSVLWIDTIHTIKVWIWALVYIQIGELASALYFSRLPQLRWDLAILSFHQIGSCSPPSKRWEV